MACFFIVVILWVFSVCLHEFGHAFVALKGGDYTVREKGYLTLNPLRYTHPVYSIAMPLLFLALGGIGLPGGAVYIERQLLRSRGWDTLVSLGGPAMDVIMVILISLLFKIGVIPANPATLATISMAFVLQLQICSVLLNLLPVPPLDGFQALAPWIPEETRARMYAASNMTLFGLFLVMFYSEPANHAFWGAIHSISEWLGVPAAWGGYGYHAFKFWAH
jgi:Zn-dependent protease